MKTFLGIGLILIIALSGGIAIGFQIKQPEIVEVPQVVYLPSEPTEAQPIASTQPDVSRYEDRIAELKTQLSELQQE